MIPSASTQFGLTPQATYGGDSGSSTGLLGENRTSARMAQNVASSMAAFKKEREEMDMAAASVAAPRQDVAQAVSAPAAAAVSEQVEQPAEAPAGQDKQPAAQEKGLFERITSGEFGDEAAAKLILATRNDNETSSTIKQLVANASPENFDKVVEGIKASIKPRNTAEEVALESLRASINDPFMAAVSKIWNKGAEVAGNVAKEGIDIAAQAIPGAQLVREAASSVAGAIPTLEDAPTDTAAITGLKTVANLAGGIAKSVLKPEDAVKSIIEGFNPVEGAGKLQGTGILAKNQTVAQAARDAVMTAAQFIPGLSEAAIGKVSGAVQRAFSSIPKERLATFMDNSMKGNAIAAAAKAIDESTAGAKMTKAEFQDAARRNLSESMKADFDAIKNSGKNIPTRSIWDAVNKRLANMKVDLSWENGLPVVKADKLTRTSLDQIKGAILELKDKLGDKKSITPEQFLDFKDAVGQKARFDSQLETGEVVTGKKAAGAVKNAMSEVGDAILPGHSVAMEKFDLGMKALDIIEEYALKELSEKSSNKGAMAGVKLTEPSSALGALKKSGFKTLKEAAKVSEAPKTIAGKVGAAVKFGAKKVAEAGVKAAIAKSSDVPAQGESGSGAMTPEKKQEIMARLNQLGL